MTPEAFDWPVMPPAPDWRTDALTRTADTWPSHKARARSRTLRVKRRRAHVLTDSTNNPTTGRTTP